MARPKKKVVFVEEDEGDKGELTEATEEARDEEEDLVEQDVLAGLRELAGAGDARWEITRISAEPGRGGFLTTWSTSQLSKQALADVFGGGKYRVVGKRPSGQYITMRTLEIADDILPKTKRDPAPASQSGSSGAVQDVLAIIRAEREKSSESYLKWAAILIPALTPVLQNVFGGRKEGINELVTALASMKQLQGGEDNKLDSFLKMFELAQTMGGGKGGGETNWLDVLKEGLGIARPALENVIQNAANRLPAPMSPASTTTATASSANIVPSLAAPAAGIPSAPTAQESGDPMLKLLPWLKNQLEFLIVKAARDSDPELYAEVLVDNIPDGVPAEKILEMLKREDWWSMLSTFSPGVAPYIGWFAQLRAAIIIAIEGPDERINQGMDQPHHGHDVEE